MGVLVLIITAGICYALYNHYFKQKYITPSYNYEYIDDPVRVLKNNIGLNHTNFSHLSPEEAELELSNKKKNGEYLPTEDWFGYKDRINSKHDDLYLPIIKQKSPSDLHKWYQQKSVVGFGDFSSKVLAMIHIKLASEHEQSLLIGLRSIRPNQVPEWVQTCKKSGFFFSEKVYRAVREKYLKSLK